MNAPFSLAGQGWLQLGELSLAFLLAAAVGLEREVRQKSAGLRTYSLVGVSAALFMLVSKYGFMDVLENGRVVVDPSRVAAQIVSGIGFIGGGVIFMRRNVVRGLTTAASVWLTSALGMACGAGLPVLAVATTVGYFLIMFAYPKLVMRFLPREQAATTRVRIGYKDRAGLLQSILVTCTELRFVIEHVDVDRASPETSMREEAQDLADLEGREIEPARDGMVTLTLQVSGKQPVPQLIARLSEMAGVVRASSVESGDSLE